MGIVQDFRHDAFYSACRKNKTEKAIRMAPKPMGDSGLLYGACAAAENGNAEIVKACIENGLLDRQKQHFAKGGNWCVVSSAARNGNIEILELLKDAGANPLARDQRAFQEAKEHGQLEAMYFLKTWTEEVLEPWKDKLPEMKSPEIADEEKPAQNLRRVDKNKVTMG